MNIKNISKYLFISSLIFLFSCKSLDFLPKENEFKSEYKEVKEKYFILDLFNQPMNNLDIEDFYNNLQVINWSSKNEFVKINTFKSFGNKYQDSKPLITFVYDNKFISLDYESKLNIFDLMNFKNINSIDLKINSNLDTFYPTSIARVNDNFFVSYSDGKILSFNLDGEINWSKYYKDIIKTPIKIYNNNLIILLSNKIVSINLYDGDPNWEFLFESDNVLQALGGDIININHLLFFILPNGRVGEIDTIFGEKNDSILSEMIFNDSINNSFDKLHSYKNILSYFDQKKYLTSIDITQNKILLNNKIIDNVNSFIFFNNGLITFHKEGILKLSNIINRNLFWELDISHLVNNDDNIINVTNSSEALIIFFNSGIVIEINSLNGHLISNKNFNIKDINKITFTNNFFLAHHENGNTTILSQ